MSSGDDPIVAVVDDDKEVLELYSSWLADQYEVRRARDGAEALRLIDQTVDVVVLDRVLPEFSGDTVLRRLRGRRNDAMVALTTAVAPDTDLIGLPFDEYLEKPIDRGELVFTVETLVRRTYYDRPLQEAFSLASKLAVLKRTIPEHERTSDPDYVRLRNDLERAVSQADKSLDWLVDQDAIRATFADI